MMFSSMISTTTNTNNSTLYSVYNVYYILPCPFLFFFFFSFIASKASFQSTRGIIFLGRIKKVPARVPRNEAHWPVDTRILLASGKNV